jgi:isopenicillin-N N-acyltransferase-like protein
VAAPFPLIEIEGEPHARGVSYGRQAGERIARGLAVYGASLSRPRAVAAARRFLADLEAYDAGLVAELRGIAQGAQQPIEAIVALNARTELTAWDAGAGDECTAALAMPERTANGVLLHGQNWDWRPDCIDTCVVLRIRCPAGPDILTFCEAGQLARHGLNSHGLALTANGLQTDDELAPGGIPSPFIRRRMLMAGSLAEATGILLTTRRSSSQNLMVSHAGGRGRSEALNFEATPREIFWSLPEHGLLAHANHFKHPVALAKVTDVGLLRHPESLYRDRRVLAHLEADGAAIAIASFERALADDYGAPNAVCRSPSQRSDGSVSATVASLIMDAAAGRLLIAPEPYRGVRYHEYRLDR